jgi:hypothetical protein
MMVRESLSYGALSIATGALRYDPPLMPCNILKI